MKLPHNITKTSDRTFPISNEDVGSSLEEEGDERLVREMVHEGNHLKGDPDPEPVLVLEAASGHTNDTSSWRQKRTRSILKQKHSDANYLKNARGSWKTLPAPDLKRIHNSTMVVVLEPQLDDDHDREDDNTTARNTKRRTVQFCAVHIRNYQQTIGDNPAVSCGTPIQLDWDYEECEPICINQYEGNRPPRRTFRQMVIRYHRRKHTFLYCYGYSEEELKVAKKQANRIRNQRSRTKALVSVTKIEDAIESARRKTKRIWSRVKGCHICSSTGGRRSSNRCWMESFSTCENIQVLLAAYSFSSLEV
jgi:hypothetical protein